MSRVMTMGEILLRLAPPNHQKIEQASTFDISFGGGEANVAISLAQLKVSSGFVTKLPAHSIGRAAKQFLDRYGVNTDQIRFGGQRLGSYYLEKGFSKRSSKVIYDREFSSFSQSKQEEYCFEEIFQDAEWFHISGITPALNQEMFSISLKALQVAKEKGITTSCDLNYRSSLWGFQEAREKMSLLAKYIDVCIGIEPLSLVNEQGIDRKDLYSQPKSIEDYKEIMRELMDAFHFQSVAMTIRESVSVHCNRLRAMLYNGEAFHTSKEVEVEFVDRVGAGDAFSAGIIYGLINKFKPQDVIDFAHACFVLKHTIEGDCNIMQIDDLQDYLNHQGVATITR